jgi:Tfp pilus assembly protein PilO
MKNLKGLGTDLFRRIRTEYRKSAAVSFGLFLVALILGAFLLGRFLAGRRQSAETEAGLLVKKVEYQNSLVRNKDALKKNLDDLENRWRFIQAKVFTEPSDDLAFSHLQQILVRLATARNMAIKSYKFESPRRVGDFSVLPVNLEWSAPYEEIVAALASIESQPFYLKVSDLEIRSLGGDESLLVRMIVEGYRHHEKVGS